MPKTDYFCANNFRDFIILVEVHPVYGQLYKHEILAKIERSYKQIVRIITKLNLLGIAAREIEIVTKYFHFHLFPLYLFIVF